MRISINRALALDRLLKERVNDLKRLRSEVAVKKVSSWMSREGQQEEITPQYDIRKLDRKALLLQQAIYEIDAMVKESNASTTVELSTSIDELLTPLE